jgi:hypothetical protein
MVACGHQNEAHNRNLIIANKSFQNVSEFRYVGTKEIKIGFTKKLRADIFGE